MRTGTILFVAPQARFFLSHRARIALAAKEAGWHIVVACPPSLESETLREMGFEYAALPMARSGLNPLREVCTARRLRKTIAKHSPDLIHLITAKSALSGGLACLFRPVPTVVAVTGLGFIFAERSLSTRIISTLLLFCYRKLLNRCDVHFLFQNSDDMAIFRNAGILNYAEASLIPGAGVDLCKISPKPFPPGQPIVVLPARMLRMKGVEDFRAAALLLHTEGVEVKMRLVGDPDPSNPTSMTLEELKGWVGAGELEWLPHQIDMDDVLRHCHIVALPSRGGEGLPKTLIDAAAAGRPAVTTSVPGCRDAVVDGETGLLCPPRDPLALANLIRRLVEDRELRETMGAKARYRAERVFDIGQVIRTHLEIYGKLVPRAGGRS